MPQTILCNLTPYEPDEENPELQIGDSTEEVPQKMIIKVSNFSFKTPKKTYDASLIGSAS